MILFVLYIYLYKPRNLKKLKKLYERQPSQNKIVPNSTNPENNTQSAQIEILRNKITAIQTKNSRETVYYEVNPDDIKEYNR
jgi:hypothetical protein